MYEIRQINRDGELFLIASREKALADILYKQSGIDSEDTLARFILESMRIDMDIWSAEFFSKVTLDKLTAEFE